MCESIKDTITQSKVDKLVDGLSKTVLNENVQELSSKQCLQKLNALKCPFTWLPANQHVRDRLDLISRIEEKIEEITEGGFLWRTFVLKLCLCYEYFCKDNIAESFNKQRDCEIILNNAGKLKASEEGSTTIPLEGLWHVCLSCKCFLTFETGLFSKTEQTLSEILPFSQMSIPQQASIWGCQSAIYLEYGYNGTKESVNYANQAIKLNPNEGEWHFLLGKALGRIRRIDNFTDIPQRKEVNALETAIKLTKNPSYMLFLAQAYREVSFRVFSINRNDMTKFTTTCSNMNEKASDLYRKSLEVRKDCAHVNIRCAQGFMKLPSPYRDFTLAKECIDMALKSSPNNAMVNHTAGMYFDHQKDITEAKKYYTLAGEYGAYGAYMDLFKIKYKENNDYDPIPELEKLLICFKEVPRHQETLCQLGSYCLLIKNDLMAALRYWQRVMEKDPQSEKLKIHKCIFVKMHVPINIHEIIFDETRLFLRNNLGTPEDRKILRKIIIDYSFSQPHLGKESPKPRRKLILDEAVKLEKAGWRSRSRFGRGRGRGRGRGGERGRGRGGERGRGRGGERGRGRGNVSGITDNRSQSRSKLNYSPNQGRGRGSRNSSTDSRAGSQTGKNSFSLTSTTQQLKVMKLNDSRDSSVESTSRQLRNMQLGSSRDSSVESSKRFDRSSLDNNWRSGPRNFGDESPVGTNIKLGGRQRTDSLSSIGSEHGGLQTCQQDFVVKKSRIESYSSDDGNADISRSRNSSRQRNQRQHSSTDENWRSGARIFEEQSSEGIDVGPGRIRTDSVSSVGSESEGLRGWSQGCSGFGKPRTNSCSSGGDGANNVLSWMVPNSDNTGNESVFRHNCQKDDAFNNAREWYKKDSNYRGNKQRDHYQVRDDDFKKISRQGESGTFEEVHSRDSGGNHNKGSYRGMNANYKRSYNRDSDSTHRGSSSYRGTSHGYERGYRHKSMNQEEFTKWRKYDAGSDNERGGFDTGNSYNKRTNSSRQTK